MRSHCNPVGKESAVIPARPQCFRLTHEMLAPAAGCGFTLEIQRQFCSIEEKLALAPDPLQEYSETALAVPRPSHFSPATCAHSCSLCATKGGGWMETPIYGVLILDPSDHSPLELVKSSGAHLVRGAGIRLCGSGGTSSVTPEAPPSRFAVHPARAHADRSVRATHACPRAEMPAPHMKE